MDIQNLTPQELEQLQTLLNKMNPTTQPTIDPVEKMIEDIMDEFDFKRIQSVMDHLNWQWAGEGVPTIESLRKTAERLLRGAIKSRLGEYKNEHHHIGIVNGTGGFEAKAWCDETKTKIVALDLKFILESWDESIEE